MIVFLATGVLGLVSSPSNTGDVKLAIHLL